MLITINITQDVQNGNFKAKIGTSIGGGQEKIRNADFSEIANKVVEILEKANTDGYIGKK